jgi:serine/threonine protein kinase
MGQIFRAWDEVFQREVAIKVLLPNADRQRFITEARITAQLSHPSIPPVYALGELPDGTLYLVMKLIRGETLAQSLARRSHTLENLGHWLDVFEQVARAIGFAHAHGIIHRDLKPGNIMVGPFGEVQVMDWGVAKVLRRSPDSAPMISSTSADAPSTPVASNSEENSTPTSHSQSSSGGSRVTEEKPTSGSYKGERQWECPEEDSILQAPVAAQKNAQTLSGQVLGTPAYMAPEQARGEKIDARADVFALGGILATILTGQEVFRGQSPLTMVVRAATGDTTEIVTRLRQCPVDEELIHLACDCLAVLPEQRPPDGLAVAQRLSSYRYTVEQRLRAAEMERAAAQVREAEQRRRRRLLGYAASALVGVLLLGITGITLALVEARRAVYSERLAKQRAEENHLRAEETAADARAAQQLAELRQLEAEQAQQRAERHAREAQQRQAETQTLLDFLERHILAAGRPAGIEGGRGYNITLRQTLDFALPYLSTTFPDHPFVEARLRDTLGKTYLYLGDVQKAEHLLRTAHALYHCTSGPTHPLTLQSLNTLAVALSDMGRHAEARAILEPLYLHYRHHLGPDHPSTLQAALNLAVQYFHLELFPQALELQIDTRRRQLRTLGANHPQTLRNFNNLIATWQKLGNHEHALHALEELVIRYQQTLGPHHIDTLTAQTDLATTLFTLRRTGDAFSLYQRILEVATQHFGPDHPDTFALRLRVAHAHYLHQHFSQALAQTQELLHQANHRLGREHPLTVEARYLLAEIYSRLQRPAEAVPLYEENLQIARRNLGLEHSRTLTLIGELALAVDQLHQTQRAWVLYEEGIVLRSRRLVRYPHDLLNRLSLAGMHCNRAHLRRVQLGHPADSLDDYNRAIALLTPLLHNNPYQERAQLFLRNSHWGRAMAWEMLQQYRHADADWHAALQLCNPGDRNILEKERAHWFARRLTRFFPSLQTLIQRLISVR